MNGNGKDEELGRFLSYVLRHRPSAAGIELDAQGWADVGRLLAGCERAGKKMDRDMLERLVREDGKRRYAFSEDGSRIRANQGHSVEVDVEPDVSEPPETLFHGTASRFLESVRANGIRKGERRHVHLAADMETALEVGRRRGHPALIRVNAGAMHRNGYAFYLSANGVWLCDYVPWAYCELAEG